MKQKTALKLGLFPIIAGISILSAGFLTMEQLPISYNNEFSSNFFVFAIGFGLVNVRLFILIRFIITPKVKKEAIEEGWIPRHS